MILLCIAFNAVLIGLVVLVYRLASRQDWQYPDTRPNSDDTLLRDTLHGPRKPL
jgi:hypothetical protein